MITLKQQSNGPFYSNTVVGTLAVDGWAVTFSKEKERIVLREIHLRTTGLEDSTARMGLGGLWPRPIPLLTVRTAYPSTASVYQLHII